MPTGQYARLVSAWLSSIGLDRLKHATHSLRRTKATLIYRRKGNLRAVQLLGRAAALCPEVAVVNVAKADPVELASGHWPPG
jgi:hypothetical protein